LEASGKWNRKMKPPLKLLLWTLAIAKTVTVSLPSGESAGENTVETEATRIEEIRAETTIAVAAIEADVETARIEADTERNATWQEEKAALEASLQGTAAKVELLTAQAVPVILTPQAGTGTAGGDSGGTGGGNWKRRNRPR
jgi:hypothetical protein